jgi:hypothetical protein
MKFEYPGDPPADVAIMSRPEFRKHYDFTLHDEEEAYARGADFVAIPEEDEIVCDGCNKDIAGEVYVLRCATPGQCNPADRAYCQDCAQKDLLPYCK